MIFVAAVAFGLACGSFVNVLVARVPAGEDWVREPSHCPRCGHRIAWYDNIPVLSWLWLRRRCRHCRKPISGRYPAVELLVAALFVGVAALAGPSALALALVYLACVSVALVFIDLDVQRLPDSVVLPSMGVVGALLIADAAIGGAWWPLLRAGVGFLALGGFYLLMVTLYPRGMGWGDVKTAALLGMPLGYVGWSALAVGAFFGPILGGLAVLPGLIARKVSLSTRIPYGPALIAGAWVGLLAGSLLFRAYVRLFT